MAKYYFRTRTTEVEVTQWFKNGDHPEDDSRPIYDSSGKQSFLSEGKVVRRFRSPEVRGAATCSHCGEAMNDHGWIDKGYTGYQVCPGSWVTTESPGEYYVYSNDYFTSNFVKTAGEAVSDGSHTMAELYRYRMLYHAGLATILYSRVGTNVVKSKRHHDGELCFDGDYFIVVMELETGQVSNHYPIADWEMFDVPAVDLPPVWDGHTSAEAEDRLRRAISARLLYLH